MVLIFMQNASTKEQVIAEVAKMEMVSAVQPQMKTITALKRRV
jgi:hypothetical protein